MPLEEIVSVRAAGYNGYYDVELIGEEIEASDYPSLVAHAETGIRRAGGGAMIPPLRRAGVGDESSLSVA